MTLLCGKYGCSRAITVLLKEGCLVPKASAMAAYSEEKSYVDVDMAPFSHASGGILRAYVK